MKNIIDNKRDKIILFTTIILGIALVFSSFSAYYLTTFNASYGTGWVSAFWGAYNGDITGTLLSIGGTYLTLAAAAVGALASPLSVALFL